MDDVALALADKQSVSLTTYVIGLCRKFKLFASERTTIVTHNEEMQILQYCSALHNKQVYSKFDANIKQCDKMHSEMINQRTLKLDVEVQSKLFSAKNQNFHSETDLDKTPSNKQLPSTDTGNDENTFSDHCSEKEDCPIGEKQKNEFDDALKSVMSLFFESLKSSNHVTLLEVFEKFVGEVLDTESKLHAFVKTDFKMKTGMRLCEQSLLSRVEVLALNALRSIVGIDSCKDEATMSNPTLKSSQVNNSESESLMMSQLSSPSTARQRSETPQRLRGAKTPVQVFKSKYGLSDSPSLPVTPFTPSTDLERGKIHQKFIENIFRCYLHLLVNTRCELALASVFNIPERELNHEAFTHLKHESAASGLSMYQTMSSILMRVRLGGNAYAPPSDSPLLSYIKGLMSLFDFVDTLQTVIEEAVSIRTGCKRVVNVLKRNISMCKSRRFPSSVVEPVANALWDVMDDILSRMEEEGKGDNFEDSQYCGVMGQGSINAFQKYLDQTSTAVTDVERYLLADVRFSQDTPTRFPCLMSRFRSPMSIVEEEPEDTESTSATSKSEKQHFPVSNVSEALLFDDDEADKMSCTPLDLDNVYVIPSKTIVHPKRGADYGEISEELFSPAKKTSTNQRVEKKRGPNKRKKKADVGEKEDKVDAADENSPRPKSTKNCDEKRKESISVDNGISTKDGGVAANKKQNKSCRRKLLPQIKGQSKITGFFKV